MNQSGYVRCNDCNLHYHKTFSEIHKASCSHKPGSDPDHPYISDVLLVSSIIVPSIPKDDRKQSVALKSVSSEIGKDSHKGFGTSALGLREEHCLYVNPSDMSMFGIGRLVDVATEIGGVKKFFHVRSDCKLANGSVRLSPEGVHSFPFKLNGKKARISKISKIEKLRTVYLQPLGETSNLPPSQAEEFLRWYFKHSLFECGSYLYTEGQIITFKKFHRSLSYEIKQLIPENEGNNISVMSSPSPCLPQTPKTPNINESMNSPRVSTTPYSYKESTNSSHRSPLSSLGTPKSNTEEHDDYIEGDEKLTSSQRKKRRRKKKKSLVYYKWQADSSVELLDTSKNVCSEDQSKRELSPFWSNDYYRKLVFAYSKGCRIISIDGAVGCGKTKLVTEFSKREGLPIFEIPSHDDHSSWESIVKKLPKGSFILLIENFNKRTKIFQSKISTGTDKFRRAPPDCLIILTSTSRLEYGHLRISMKPLTEGQRKELLKTLLDAKPHELDDKALSICAEKTQHFTCADIVTTVKLARVRQRQADDLSILPLLELKISKTAPQFIETGEYRTQTVLWSDIFGYDEEKAELRDILRKKKENPSYQFPGILLYGPPGCSKTMLVKALVTESKYNFFPVRGSEILSKYVGDSEKNISKIFLKAKMAAPSIVFMDELDNLCGKRSASEGLLLNDLLGIFSEQSTRRNVLIIGATNRPDILDFALFTSTCFSRTIFIGVPSLEANKSFWDGLLQRSIPNHTINTTKLAEMSNGFSGAELMECYISVINDAVIKLHDYSSSQGLSVTEEDFVNHLSSGKTKTSAILSCCLKFRMEMNR